MAYKINDNGIDRAMTKKEIEIYEQVSAEIELRIATEAEAKAAKAAARQAVLDKLGLTADEVAALLG